MKPVCMADVEAMEFQELWPDRIPIGTPVYVAGKGKVGKGFTIADWIARVTNGEPFPDGGTGDFEGPGSVLVIIPEDDRGQFANRLMAAGANMDNVHDMTDGFTTPSGLADLEQNIDDISEAHPEAPVRLVYIDPISAVVEVSLTSGPVTIRREITAPLERTAAAKGVAMIVVCHTTKDGVTIAGSQTIIDAARIVLRISRLKSDPRIRIIHVECSNYSDADGTPDVAYTIVGKRPDTHVQYLDTPDDENETGGKRPPDAPARLLEVLRASKDESGILVPLDCPTMARMAFTTYANARVCMSRYAKAGTVFQPVNPETGAALRGKWSPTDVSDDAMHERMDKERGISA